MSFEKKCVCTYNCDDLELLQTNREADNNKENILQVAENEDLLEIESGVPTKNPTKLYPKRDTTKLDRKDFEDYKEETEIKINDKADKTEIPDLSEYAKKEDIPEEADLSNYATKTELNTKADKTEIPDLSEYAKKEDIPEGADLSNYATKTELNTKADKTDLSNYLTIEDARDEHDRVNDHIIELNLKPDTYSIKESSIVKNDIKVIYHIIKIFDTNSSINIKGLDSLFPSGFSNYTKIVEFLPINKFGYTLKSFSISTNHVVYNITNIDSERRPLLMRLTITPGDNLTYITGIERG